MKTKLFFICILLSSQRIVAQNSINVNGTVVTASYCEGAKIILTAATAGTTYKWESDEVAFQNNTKKDPSVTLDKTGSVTIKLTLDGVPITPITFTVNPKPAIGQIKSLVKASDIIIISFDNLPSASTTYQWIGPNGANIGTNSNQLNITGATIDQLGEYQLKVTDNSTSCINIFKHKVPEEEKKAQAPIFGTPTSEEDEMTFNYIIKRNVSVLECDLNGNLKGSSVPPPPTNSRFTLIEQKDEYSIIKFWEWKDRYVNKAARKSEVKGLSEKYNGTLDNPKFFRVANDRFGQGKQVVPHHSIWFINSLSFTAGTLVVPIKLRRSFENDKKFDFSKDFSLGGFIGARTRISHYKPHYLNLGVSLGITAVTITPQNADPTKVKEATDLAAFSHAFGAVLEFDRVQVALLRGRDLLSHYTQDGTGWKHNNTTWFGVGFGYAILSRPEKLSGSKGNNNDAR